MAYVEYTAPLAYLIEKISESTQTGKRLLPSQLEDYVAEASSASFTIIPLHVLLSSISNTYLGTFDPPSLQFVHRVINENVLVLLRDDMTRAVSRLIRDYGSGSPQEIEVAVKRASRTICLELSRIRELNRGSLPHPDLKELWERFSCKEVYVSVRDVRPFMN